MKRRCNVLLNVWLLSGGFVPREPTIDGPFYQAKYDPKKPDTAQKLSPTKIHEPEVTIRTVVPDAVTPDPSLGNGGSGKLDNQLLKKAKSNHNKSNSSVL